MIGIAAVILAGGRARRMGGGDKALLPVAGRPLLGHVLARIAPQVGGVVALNANGDPARFAGFGLPVIADALPDQPGPVAGVLAGLDWALAQGAAWLLSVPVDTPFLPGDLVRNLAAATGVLGAHAVSGARAHPVIALWPVASAPALRQGFVRGLRRMTDFATLAAPGAGYWLDTPRDPFLNLNTPEDIARTNSAWE